MAVTPHDTVKVKVDGAGNDGLTKMPLLSALNGKLAEGHILAAVEAQFTVVQLRPAEAVSLTTASAALSGPKFTAVMV